MTTNDDAASFAELYDYAMEITDQAEATRYFRRLVEHAMRSGSPREKAEADVRSNLAYLAGYFDNETRERVERLFKCAHPVFGAIAEKGPPSPEEAFQAGVEWAKRLASNLR